MTAMVGKDETKLKILNDLEHPYINATIGQCFMHVITSFSKACIVSTAVSSSEDFLPNCNRKSVTSYMNEK